MPPRAPRSTLPHVRYLAAVIQTTSTPDVSASLDAVESSVAHAASLGARLVALPENVAYLGPESQKASLAEHLDGPTFTRLSRMAKRNRLYLAAGSHPERSADPERPFNTSVLYGPDGRALGVYRKIHLFDVDLGPEGPQHVESARTAAGGEAVAVTTELGVLGLSVCYDLRFPELYVALRAAGAELLLAPSAFTVPTGADHWEVLVRARAIENQSYLLAAAQFGRHWQKRRTYGRSMLVDPWGIVIATCPDRASIAVAEVDLDLVRETRRNMPCHQHRAVALWTPPEDA